MQEKNKEMKGRVEERGRKGHERERERKLHAHACVSEGGATFLVTCMHAR